ncbi:MAG: VanW family protein [Bacillota bacterium]
MDDRRARVPSKRSRRRRKKQLPLATLVAGIVFLGVFAVGGGYFVYSQMGSTDAPVLEELPIEEQIIYHGVTIDGVPVGGLSQAETVLLLKNQYDKNADGKNLTFIYEDQSFEIPLTAIDFEFSVEESVLEAYLIGKDGTADENEARIEALLVTGTNVELPYVYDEAKLQTELQKFEPDVYSAPVDSAMEFVNGAFVVSNSKSGMGLDVDTTVQTSVNIIETDIFGIIPMSTKEIPPAVTEDDFDYEMVVIGSYSTNYTPGQANQRNLEVASEFLNGSMIAPGDEYSATVAFGEQTLENGYVAGGMFVNGKLVTGIGGGVCQVSTTLYNAALLAEIEIVQRYAHSMTVGYVPLGMDGAIAEGYKDLIVKNDTGSPIYVEAFAKDGKVTVNLHGKEIHEPGREVIYEVVHNTSTPQPDDVETEDPTRPVGEREVTYKGTVGYNVSVYKVVKQDGVEISRDYLNKSSYRAMASEVIVGTMEVEEPELQLDAENPVPDHTGPEGFVTDPTWTDTTPTPDTSTDVVPDGIPTPDFGSGTDLGMGVVIPDMPIESELSDIFEVPSDTVSEEERDF